MDKKIIVIIFLGILFLAIGCRKETNEIQVGTLEEYKNFLLKLKSDTNIIFVLQKDFEKTNDSSKIIVSIRHDIDRDLKNAMRIATIENEMGIPATYYVLHTAKYYRRKNKVYHNKKVLKYLKFLQCLGHEVAWHNNLLTLQIVYDVSPREYLAKELNWLRSNGINIYGTVAHGDVLCYMYGYLNSYFFYEYKDHYTERFPNYDSVIREDGKVVYFEKAHLSDFNLKYQGHLLHYTSYYSDALPKKLLSLDISKWKLGDKYIINFHPIRWQPENENFDKNKSLKIYPNPNDGNFYVAYIGKGIILKAKIFSLTGKLLYEKQICSKEKIFLKTNLKSGIYILRISFYDFDNIKTKTKFILVSQ